MAINLEIENCRRAWIEADTLARMAAVRLREGMTHGYRLDLLEKAQQLNRKAQESKDTAFAAFCGAILVEGIT